MNSSAAGTYKITYGYFPRLFANIFNQKDRSKYNIYHKSTFNYN